MAHPGFLSHRAPVELQQLILSHVQSIKDVLAFNRTCQHMHGAWLHGGFGLRTIWQLVVREVPGAEQALIAHRACQLIAQGERHGRTPQLLTRSMLDGMRSGENLPSGQEMRGVMDLHGFVRTVEERFIVAGFKRPLGVDNLPTAEPVERMHEWRPGMHKAIYRSFITAAALAHFYREPFLTAANRDDLMLTHKGQLMEDKHRQFLDEFPAFRQPANEQDKNTVFGEYTDWLLGELRGDAEVIAEMESKFQRNIGRALNCQHRKDAQGSCPVQIIAEDGCSHFEAHAVALELIRLVWASMALIEFLGGTKSPLPFDFDKTKSCLPIILYGQCTSQEVTFPTAPIDITVRFQLSRLDGIPPDQEGLCWIEWDYYDRLLFPHLDLFEYFLQKHMRLTFREDFLIGEPGSEDFNNFEHFRDSLLIFALDDVGERESYYPDYADLATFPDDGFLDGSDFLEGIDTAATE